MPQQQQQSPIQTLTISNFTGSLTRENFGDINSGLAKFDTSWGYNPFWKPKQLTWFQTLTDQTSLLTSGIALAGASRVESGVLVFYIITSTGHLYRFTGLGTSAVGSSDIHTLATGSPTFTYGADIRFYGAANTLYISHDLGVTKIVLTSGGAFSSEAQIGTWDATHFTPITTRRSLQEFNGNLYATNSDASVTYANNIAEINSGGTVNTYAKLSPSLPAGSYIRDLDISPDFTYLLITSSLVASELIAPVNDAGNSISTTSALYKWNGSDVGVTTGISLPQFGATATQSFGNSQILFMYDAFGTALYDGTQEILSIRKTKSPFPTATTASGNFITWMAPTLFYNADTDANSISAALYYYGHLDSQSPSGLWRMLRQDSIVGGVIYQVPYHQFASNRYISVDGSFTLQVDSSGTHIFSYNDATAGGSNFHLKTFNVAAQETATATPTACAGVYETQTQMFSNKIAVKNIRVYTESTAANNGFNLDLIGVDGKKITNGSFSYSFAAGSDPLTLTGALDRIDFHPQVNRTYGLAARITNTGSLNMAINKIEIDYIQAGK